MNPRRLVSLLILSLLAMHLAVTAEPTEASTADKPILFGLTSIDFRADIPDFTAETGKPPALVGLFWPLELEWPNFWSAGMLDELHDLGVVAYIEITTDDLDALNSGQRDAELNGLVSSLTEWFGESPDHRLVVAPLPEANLAGHAWGGDPDGYRSGYNRIRDAFRDAGLAEDQVRFAFAVNGLSDPGLTYGMFYPGDEVVDLVGFAKINRGDPWRDYDLTFDRHIVEMQLLTTTKPILITQTGTVVDGDGERGPWLTDMFNGLAADSQVLGAVYFSRDADHDYRIVVDGTVDPAVVDGYSTWSHPSNVAWIFDGSMDAWVAEREDEIVFSDIAGSPFDEDIVWVAQNGITLGCGPRLFCPDDAVTRGQMASFLARALGYPVSTTDWFSDDDGGTHESNINAVADAGVTLGCTPGLYCPDGDITRGQMASFLARALGYPVSTTDWFSDDDGGTHESNINAIADAGVTFGCQAGRYCPDQQVTRGQMAAFLRRACEGSGTCATD